MALRDTLEAMQASSRALKMVLLVATLAVIAVIVAKFGRNPDLSHVKVAVISGSEDGNYHAIVDKAAAQALRERGRIENLTSAGSSKTCGACLPPSRLATLKQRNEPRRHHHIVQHQESRSL